MIKAIIIDLDGTTLPRNWHQISEGNRVALEEAGRQGVVRILATGRSVFSLNNTLPERPSGGLYGIFFRGQHHALG